MASVFCPSCGFKSEYQFSAPNFCSKCGKPYLEAHGIARSANLASQMRSSKFKNTKQPPQEEYDDEDIEDNSDESESFSNATKVPRISRLDVEIDSTTDVRVVKFEDLLNGGSSANQFPRSKNHQLGDLIDSND
jgi:hypothetical protein